MRQALGLRGDQSNERLTPRREPLRGPHRFVKDGEVPVEVLSPSREHGPGGPAPVNRIAAAEAALRSERVARERAERSLRETQATLQHVQTKLAHADLAHGEALAAERRGREQAEAALAEAIVAREALELRLAEMVAASPPQPESPPEAAKSSQPTLVKPRRKATNPAEREPQPVKWWLPSYKAKTHAN
ncbi:MAG: hypothetical protein J0H14_07210 [Alphaproteobacteria bacterium]|nr:hypothetical protein [Alphaproteobacteria bacterium]